MTDDQRQPLRGGAPSLPRGPAGSSKARQARTVPGPTWGTPCFLTRKGAKLEHGVTGRRNFSQICRGGARNKEERNEGNILTLGRKSTFAPTQAAPLGAPPRPRCAQCWRFTGIPPQNNQTLYGQKIEWW